MNKLISGIAVLVASCSATQAAEIINQDWDNTGVYFPGVTGFVGDAAEPGGRWVQFDEFDVIGISNSVANSGPQSAIVTRGGALVGRVDAVVATPDFEVSYSMYRDSEESQMIFQVGNNTSISSALDLATFTRANGAIHFFDPGLGSWVETSGIVSVGEWTNVRLAVDADAMTYDLFMTPGAGAETFIQTVNLSALPVNINAVRMNPQGNAGTITYIDDVLLTDATLDAIDGDLNGDGFVGVDDLNIVLANWNLNVPPADPRSDPTGDNFIGVADLNTVLVNWNNGTPLPPGGVGVPEPGMLSLVGLGAIGLIRRKR